MIPRLLVCVIALAIASQPALSADQCIGMIYLSNQWRLEELQACIAALSRENDDLRAIVDRHRGYIDTLTERETIMKRQVYRVSKAACVLKLSANNPEVRQSLAEICTFAGMFK